MGQTQHKDITHLNNNYDIVKRGILWKIKRFGPHLRESEIIKPKGFNNDSSIHLLVHGYIKQFVSLPDCLMDIIYNFHGTQVAFSLLTYKYKGKNRDRILTQYYKNINIFGIAKDITVDSDKCSFTVFYKNEVILFSTVSFWDKLTWIKALNGDINWKRHKRHNNVYWNMSPSKSVSKYSDCHCDHWNCIHKTYYNQENDDISYL